jgi:hypothetical protein
LFVFPGESSIQSTTRTRAIPPEKQTTIIVNTINYKNTSHSPGKTNNNRRQYNQLQEHEPFPRKKTIKMLIVLTTIIVCFSGGMAHVLVVDCIDDDCCLFFRGNASIQPTTRTRAIPPKNKQQSSSIQSTTRTRAIPSEKQTTIVVNTINYKNTSHY